MQGDQGIANITMGGDDVSVGEMPQTQTIFALASARLLLQSFDKVRRSAVARHCQRLADLATLQVCDELPILAQKVGRILAPEPDALFLLRSPFSLPSERGNPAPKHCDHRIQRVPDSVKGYACAGPTRVQPQMIRTSRQHRRQHQPESCTALRGLEASHKRAEHRYAYWTEFLRLRKPTCAVDAISRMRQQAPPVVRDERKLRRSACDAKNDANRIAVGIGDARRPSRFEFIQSVEPSGGRLHQFELGFGEIGKTT